MLNKLYEYIKKDIKQNYKGYIIFLLIVPWLFITFDYNIYAPGGLIDLGDRIEIDTNNKIDGSFNMTYVSAKKGILPAILLSYIIPSWDLVSLDESRIEEENEDEIIKRNQIYLKETSHDAIIAAFKEANMSYEIENINLTVSYIFEEAKTNLELGDIIKKVNNTKITDYKSLQETIKKLKIGDVINITVNRNNKIIETSATLIESNNTPVIGISLTELKDIKTNPEVKYIFKNNESGASRGLMCALEIYNKITEYDLTKGDIISGTGTIDENGKVGAISGIKYKLSGAVKKGAKVFIVPSENYEEALKYKKERNYDIEIIEANTLHNVIEKLKNR